MEQRSEELNQPSLSSFNELIKQNEELTARFRILLKKNAELELENTQIQQSLVDRNDEINLLHEQILIYKEKEKIIYEKIENAKFLENKIVHLQNKINEQEITIERFTRYQERIKHQVKPYIKQLKNYANELKNENEKLKEEIADYQRHIEKISQEFKNIHKFYTTKLEHYQSLFSKEREDLFELIQNLKLEIQSLQKKAELTELAQFKQNQIENEMIRIQAENKEKMNLLRDENFKLKSEIQKLQKALKLSNNQTEPQEHSQIS